MGRQLCEVVEQQRKCESTELGAAFFVIPEGTLNSGATLEFTNIQITN